MEHTGQRTRGARPSTELSEWTIDRVRRRRLPASAHNPATTASASDDQQLRPAAPTSTSTIQPPHTSPLTSQFRLERPHWSLRKLAGYLAGLGRPVRIGRERLRQLLHERGISFQRTRTRKESTDPDRDAKLDRIEYVTSAYPDRCFAFDQFGPLSIHPCHGTCWAPLKHPVRLRATYHRTHGIRYFHGCYSPGDDRLWGITREHKGAGHTLAALKSIRATGPAGTGCS